MLGFWSALALGLLGGLLWQMQARPGATWMWMTFVLVFLALAAWEIYALRVGHHVKWLGNAEGRYVLEIRTDGLGLHPPDGAAVSYGWPELAALESAPEYLVFYLRSGAAFALPTATIGAEASGAVVSQVRSLWTGQPDHHGLELPGAPTAPESPSYQAWVNLREAARLSLFLTPDVGAFRPAYGALGIHLAAVTFMLGAISYLQALPIPLFNAAGIAPFGTSILLIVGWAAAVSVLMARYASMLRMMVMTVAAMLFISIAAFYSYNVWIREFTASPGLATAWDAAILLWILAVLGRAVRAHYGRSRGVSLLAASIYVLFVLVISALAPQGTLYLNAAAVEATYAPAPSADDSDAPGPNLPGDKDGNFLDDDEGNDGNAEYPEDRLDVEEVYYRQPEMVRQALAAVKPHRAGETGLYFVGFAGDGSEHEFFNEVRYARNLLDRRFDGAGRSLLLANSYDTVNDLPLANSHNLEAVLHGLAQRMDPQRDVLFLFLSSHGAQDHWLEVSLDPLEMDDLKAEKLKELLDKSGIRNRVIVVSACYSGGFLDVLKDDNTLILTSSRRDHVAYGCGDVTEYTYFGEAYFVKALAHQDSFIGAFDEARNIIAERERAEGDTPSAPQIHVGRNIETVLRRLKVVPAASDVHPANDGRECKQGCAGAGG